MTQAVNEEDEPKPHPGVLCTKDAEVIQALSPESVVLNEYPSLKEVLARPVLLGKQRPALLPLAAVAQRRRALGSRQAAACWVEGGPALRSSSRTVCGVVLREATPS